MNYIKDKNYAFTKTTVELTTKQNTEQIRKLIHCFSKPICIHNVTKKCSILSID